MNKVDKTMFALFLQVWRATVWRWTSALPHLTIAVDKDVQNRLLLYFARQQDTGQNAFEQKTAS